MRYKRNGYNAITNNFLVDSNSDEITKEKIAFGAEVVKLLEVFMDAPYFT